MVIGRVLKDKDSGIFHDDFYDLRHKLEREGNVDFNFKLFSQIPKLAKTDVLEYFAIRVLDLAIGPFGEDDGSTEVDSLFFNYPEEDLLENDIKPSYASEYINTVGQLFLAGYIEFGLCNKNDTEENHLSRVRDDKYQAWIHFRDNYFYTAAYLYDMIDLKERYKDMSNEDYQYSNWDTPKFWNMYHFWVCRTPKGTKYFKEVLAPKFYNKYKDLEVEVDDEGKVIRWIGQINR
ncbi:hypothetical protein [Campylobacter troglodytis]|uniref:hypothetical protein n=1 Tax=Campylobacter troglodytis TaxID=654363 RepID=UPI0011575464|nr:hypothetical protein [Campylobacter troglodytis]TQR53005.1 hypothetical protein DMC01_12380 [Campylobacter troglodytis]